MTEADTISKMAETIKNQMAYIESLERKEKKWGTPEYKSVIQYEQDIDELKNKVKAHEERVRDMSKKLKDAKEGQKMAEESAEVLVSKINDLEYDKIKLMDERDAIKKKKGKSITKQVILDSMKECWRQAWIKGKAKEGSPGVDDRYLIQILQQKLGSTK